MSLYCQISWQHEMPKDGTLLPQFNQHLSWNLFYARPPHHLPSTQTWGFHCGGSSWHTPEHITQHKSHAVNLRFMHILLQNSRMCEVPTMYTHLIVLMIQSLYCCTNPPPCSSRKSMSPLFSLIFYHPTTPDFHHSPSFPSTSCPLLSLPMNPSITPLVLSVVPHAQALT